MKKHFILFLFLFGFAITVSAQVRPLPANIDTTKIDPKQIPSPEKLKQLGATDEEIKMIIDFKNRKLAEQQPIELKKEETPKPEEKKEEEVKAPPRPELPPARIYGQEFFRNNNLKYFEKATEIKAPENYIIGVGDEIGIAVWGFSDYNEVFKVDKDGFIKPKEAGRIYVRGMRFSEARDLIVKKFSTFLDLNNSGIDVTLVYSKIITVNIVGEVFAPGSYTIPSINTAFNALIAASGPTQIGSVRKIFVKRNGENVATLDVYKFLFNPDSKEDFFMENNDYIFVPTAQKVIKISGEIKRPHNYELLDNENLNSLIKFAGGLPPSASTKTITVKRFENNEQKLMDVRYDSLLLTKKDFILSDGDEVLIHKINERIENRVNITGAVQIPGEYELKMGDKLSDLIDKAKGLTYNTYMEKAHIERLNDDFSKSVLTVNLKNALLNKNSNDNIKLQKYDSVKVFYKSEFQDKYSISVYGSVRNPGNFNYGDGMTLKDALYLAGGLKKEAALNRIDISRTLELDKATNKIKAIAVQLKTIEIGLDLSIDAASEGFLLQPYDQIKVREEPDYDLQENIKIDGEVQYPGVYTLLNKKETLYEVITRAGGLTQWAFPEAATIYRKEHNAGFLVMDLPRVMEYPKSKYNYVLKEGDSLHIPRTNDLVQIKGSVEYPDIDVIKRINSPYHKSKSAAFYVREYALGFSKLAWKRKTYVEQPGGKVDKTVNFLFLRFYPKVEKGAIVYVPKKEVKEARLKKAREPIDWNKTIESITIKVTGLATLYLLLNKIK